VLGVIVAQDQSVLLVGRLAVVVKQAERLEGVWLRETMLHAASLLQQQHGCRGIRALVSPNTHLKRLEM